MPIINKQPAIVTREYAIEEPVALVVERYAAFIQSTPDYVVNSALTKVLFKDAEFMIQRILSSKNFVACLLAAATGMALYFKLPFPAENVFLQLMALRAPLVHEGLFYSYNLFLFTTPYIAYSIVLSGLYVFGLTVHKKIRAGKLPLYPDPRKRDELFVVVGEVHNNRKPGHSDTPHSLSVPERGLFTGTAIVGAIGTGKTSC